MKYTGNAFDTVTGEIFPAREINIRSHDYPHRTFLMMNNGTTPLFNLQNNYFGYLSNGNFIKVSMRDTFIGTYPKARNYKSHDELKVDIAYMKRNNCMDSGIVHEMCEQCALYDPMADIPCLCKPARDEYIAEQLLKDKLNKVAFRKASLESHKLELEEKQRLHEEEIALQWDLCFRDADKYAHEHFMPEMSDECADELKHIRTDDVGYGTLRSRPGKTGFGTLEPRYEKKPFWKFW